MGWLRSQPPKPIGEIVFHQQDLIRHISKHRRSLVHYLTLPPYKTRVVIEVVTTFSSFRFPELSQPI